MTRYPLLVGDECFGKVALPSESLRASEHRTTIVLVPVNHRIVDGERRRILPTPRQCASERDAALRVIRIESYVAAEEFYSLVQAVVTGTKGCESKDGEVGRW